MMSNDKESSEELKRTLLANSYKKYKEGIFIKTTDNLYYTFKFDELDIDGDIFLTIEVFTRSPRYSIFKYTTNPRYIEVMDDELIDMQSTFSLKL